MDHGLRNLTPHEVVIRLDSGETIRIPPHHSGPARAISMEDAVKRRHYVDLLENTIPLYPRPKYVAILGLPENSDKVKKIIVSETVARLLVDDYEMSWLYRGIILVPDTSPMSAIKDKDGKIVAVKGLIQYY